MRNYLLSHTEHNVPLRPRSRVPNPSITWTNRCSYFPVIPEVTKQMFLHVYRGPEKKCLSSLSTSCSVTEFCQKRRQWCSFDGNGRCGRSGFTFLGDVTVGVGEFIGPAQWNLYGADKRLSPLSSMGVFPSLLLRWLSSIIIYRPEQSVTQHASQIYCKSVTVCRTPGLFCLLWRMWRKCPLHSYTLYKIWMKLNKFSFLSFYCFSSIICLFDFSGICIVSMCFLQY